MENNKKETIKEITKEEYIKFFELILEKDNIELFGDIDLNLARDLFEPYIYYPREINDFFETTPMKRLAKINHLGNSICLNSNAYHTRLDHCKGAYKNALDFWVYKCRDEDFKKELEKSSKKRLYTLVDIMDMAKHDDGHLMISHCLESLICNGKEDHDQLGKKILRENKEYKTALENIKPGLYNAMLEKSEFDNTAFKFLREGNIDFDRLDYLQRDSLYLGKPYDRNLVNNILLKCNIREIKDDNGKEIEAPIYEYSALKDIEVFLSLRSKAYIEEYNSKDSKCFDYLFSYLSTKILEDDEIKAPYIKDAVENYDKDTLKEIDINKHLETNDIKFYNELLSIYLNNEDENLEAILATVLPNIEGLLSFSIYMMDTKQKGSDISKYEDYELDMIRTLKQLRSKVNIEKYKKLDKSDRDKHIISKKLIDEKEYLKIKNDISEILDENNIKNSRGIIFKDKKIKIYEKEEPVYVEDEENNVYKLEEHPDLEISLEPIDNYIIGIFPDILRIEKIDEKVIEQLKNKIYNAKEFEEDVKLEEDKKDGIKNKKANMSLWKTGKSKNIIGFEEDSR